MAKKRLGYYRRHYWGTAFHVDAAMELSRPATRSRPEWSRASASASVQFSPKAGRCAGEFSDATFEFFTSLCALQAPLWARGTWSYGLDRGAYESASGATQRAERGEVSVPGFRTLMYLPPEAVEQLGGRERIATEAPARDIVPIALRDGRTAVGARLCREPLELTTELLMQWRAYLRPVALIADPAALAAEVLRNRCNALDILGK